MTRPHYDAIKTGFLLRIHNSTLERSFAVSVFGKKKEKNANANNYVHTEPFGFLKIRIENAS